MFKALRLASLMVFALSTVALPAHALDATAWAADHPEVKILSSDELMMIEAPGAKLEDFQWIARPLVIFADSPNDPRFVKQMESIAKRPLDLAERDVVVIVDTDPGAKSAIREALRPRGFDLVLIGKDGQKYLRKPLPWDVREISRSIDKMPDRQQELRDERATE